MKITLTSIAALLLFASAYAYADHVGNSISSHGGWEPGTHGKGNCAECSGEGGNAYGQTGDQPAHGKNGTRPAP